MHGRNKLTAMEASRSDRNLSPVSRDKRARKQTDSGTSCPSVDGRHRPEEPPSGRAGGQHSAGQAAGRAGVRELFASRWHLRGLQEGRVGCFFPEGPVSSAAFPPRPSVLRPRKDPTGNGRDRGELVTRCHPAWHSRCPTFPGNPGVTTPGTPPVALGAQCHTPSPLVRRYFRGSAPAFGLTGTRGRRI